MNKIVNQETVCRNEYIDIAKFWGIFLMVLCHAGFQNKGTVVIYAFHMPLFFFLSGYLYKRNRNIQMKKYLWKKIYSILIPYLIFSLIMCFGTGKMVDWLYILYGSRDALEKACTFTPLWFLPCFFLSTVVYYILQKVSGNNGVYYYIIIIAVSVLGFAISKYRSFLPYGYPANLDVALVGVLLMEIGRLTNRLRLNMLSVKLGGGTFVSRCMFVTFKSTG